ncbi:hypothetical protein BKA70DRAFT_1416553 [Coprinopsis sp. MPI-PUGE-AT-0042]|nr:hypothetical protein BKA70DRAFT_1416553 [Coprinopsis sp. MPI-PUGE-AT-0042]
MDRCFHAAAILSSPTIPLTSSSLKPPAISPFERWLLSIQDELRVYILWFVQPVDLINLSATSIVVYSILWHYRSHVWGIENFLRLWFPHPQSFLGQLALTSAVISGSQVIRFFDRLCPKPESDIDIFTRIGSVLALGRYLFAVGYVLATDGTDTHNYELGFNARVLDITQGDKLERLSGVYGILSVFNFYRQTLTPNGISVVLKVQVIVVNSDPVDHVIHGFHSSK